MNEELEIGLVTGAFGVGGEVKVVSLNGEPERFADLENILLADDEDDKHSFRIESVRIHKGVALVKLEGIDSRTDAEKLKGCNVYLINGDLTTAEIESIERQKLIGLEVYTSGGERLGVIEEVILTGANDVYSVVDGEKSILIPAIDDVIRSKDIDKGRITVDLLPGLL